MAYLEGAGEVGRPLQIAPKILPFYHDGGLTDLKQYIRILEMCIKMRHFKAK